MYTSGTVGTVSCPVRRRHERTSALFTDFHGFSFEELSLQLLCAGDVRCPKKRVAEVFAQHGEGTALDTGAAERQASLLSVVVGTPVTDNPHGFRLLRHRHNGEITFFIHFDRGIARLQNVLVIHNYLFPVEPKPPRFVPPSLSTVTMDTSPIAGMMRNWQMRSPFSMQVSRIARAGNCHISSGPQKELSMISLVIS